MGLKSEETVSRYAAKGMPREADGSFDVDKCRAWRQANIRPRCDNERLAKWKARHEREKAKLARIRRLKEEVRLIDVRQFVQEILAVCEPISVAVDAVEGIECHECEPALKRVYASLLESQVVIGQMAERIVEHVERAQSPRSRIESE